MQLILHSHSPVRKVSCVDVSDQATVGDLMKVVENLDVNVNWEDYYLASSACVLTGNASDKRLTEYGLSELSVVYAVLRCRGGKVHGSLARAGKVKAQTPKVEKKEKRKQKTGRAKRRMQYVRRFVNAVAVGPGRRRGPNANT